jgi:hypothetical protein
MTSFSSSVMARNHAYESKEEGIQSAYDHTSEEWKDAALTIMYDLALNRPLICADDVVRVLETFPELERSYGGLPGLFKVAEEKGWVTVAMCSCGEEKKHRVSERLSNHGREILVYRSKLS